MNTPQVTVERLTAYTENDAIELGKLMSSLSTRFDGQPVSRELLETIISSPSHDQIVARLDGHIVGAATVGLVMGAGAGRHGHLEDFVTDPEIRRQGVGNKIWDEVIKWCKEQGVNLYFTSRPSRSDAHAFYLAHGAMIKDTTVFYVATEK